MRPAGEIRQVLLDAARAHVEQHGPATWRDLAQAAQVGLLVARRTVETMERAGVLNAVGRDQRAHSHRWMKLYEPAGAPAARWDAHVTPTELAQVTRRWVVSA